MGRRHRAARKGVDRRARRRARREGDPRRDRARRFLCLDRGRARGLRNEREIDDGTRAREEPRALPRPVHRRERPRAAGIAGQQRDVCVSREGAVRACESDRLEREGGVAAAEVPAMKLAVTTATPVTTLALIGGGEFSFGETREIDELLLARMPADRRTIAFLPTASGSAEYAVHLGEYFRRLDPSVEVINVPIYRGRDARRPKNLNAILGAGMVYLGGGVTNNLLATIHQSPVDIAMRDAAEGGAVIAAIGAAASCFGI